MGAANGVQLATRAGSDGSPRRHSVRDTHVIVTLRDAMRARAPRRICGRLNFPRPPRSLCRTASSSSAAPPTLCLSTSFVLPSSSSSI